MNPGLYRQVRALLDLNKAERHIRGGLATRRKYKGDTADETTGEPRNLHGPR